MGDKIAYKPRKSQKIDVPKAMDLKYNHKLSNADIAAYFGVQPHSVSQRLAQFVENLPTVEELQHLDSARTELFKATLYKN